MTHSTQDVVHSRSQVKKNNHLSSCALYTLTNKTQHAAKPPSPQGQLPTPVPRVAPQDLWLLSGQAAVNLVQEGRLRAAGCRTLHLPSPNFTRFLSVYFPSQSQPLQMGALPYPLFSPVWQGPCLGYPRHSAVLDPVLTPEKHQ